MKKALTGIGAVCIIGAMLAMLGIVGSLDIDRLTFVQAVQAAIASMVVGGIGYGALTCADRIRG